MGTCLSKKTQEKIKAGRVSFTGALINDYTDDRIYGYITEEKLQAKEGSRGKTG